MGGPEIGAHRRRDSGVLEKSPVPRKRNERKLPQSHNVQTVLSDQKFGEVLNENGGKKEGVRQAKVGWSSGGMGPIEMDL